MKYLTILFILLKISIINAQIKDGWSLGVGTIYAQNNTSGYFELGKPLEPTGERGKHNLNDKGLGIKGIFGYSKIFNQFYIGTEIALDYISSQKEEQLNNNWNFSIKNGLGIDLSILLGMIIKEKYLLYGKTGFIPYSRYIISANHNIHGQWEDHNFLGVNFGVGNRINMGSVDLKFEIKNSFFNFKQPLKDGAISSQSVNQWDFEIGIVKTFANNGYK